MENPIQDINSVIQNGFSKPDESDFDEDYKDSLFINTSVNAFIFGGYNHGVIRSQISPNYLCWTKKLDPVELNKHFSLKGKRLAFWYILTVSGEIDLTDG